MLDGGGPTADAKAVIDIVADYDAVRATGHLGEAEIRAVVDYALGRGHRRIVVTHPEMQCPNFSIDTRIELAREGCLMEYCAVNCMPMFQAVTSDQMKEAIDAVGPENAVIATDSGQPFSPKLPDMFRSFAQVLHEKGVSLEALAAMAIRNPTRLLGIEPRNTGVVPMDELYGVAQGVKANGDRRRRERGGGRSFAARSPRSCT